MRIVRRREDVAQAFDACQSEAGSAFGSSEIYCEKYVERARHVEVQVLGDKNGIRIHLGERECSVQRRHQKLLEESPAPNLGAETRSGLHRAALTVAAAVNYSSAGTVEFIVDAEERYYFIEMNTRIQVEHPVTEMVTGIDLVREQIRIAAGEALGYRQDDVRLEGHAIECRINAEDPETFAPSAGRVVAWVPPGGFKVRVDSHLMAPYVVPPFYDSLLAKVIVHGGDRAEAVGRMRRALAETVVEGVETSIPFRLQVLNDPAFLQGRFTSVDPEPRQAKDDGADYIAVGAMFPTATKRDFQLVGPDLLRQVRPETSRPLIGIGGITPENAAEVIRAGADGVAVISAVCGAPDPAAAARRFLEAIRTARDLTGRPRPL